MEPAPWTELVLVCAKCMRRQGREDLRGELKRALRRAGCRDLRVTTAGCLDLCPKRDVALLRGGELGGPRPLLRVVPPGCSADALADWLLATAQDPPAEGDG